MSQKEQILRHLKLYQQITPIDALNEYGCFRLAARVYDLRREGHVIEEERHDGGYAVYRMAPPAGQGNLFGGSA